MHGNRHVVERKAVDQHPCRILALLHVQTDRCKVYVLEARETRMTIIQQTFIAKRSGHRPDHHNVGECLCCLGPHELRTTDLLALYLSMYLSRQRD